MLQHILCIYHTSILWAALPQEEHLKVQCPTLLSVLCQGLSEDSSFLSIPAQQDLLPSYGRKGYIGFACL